MWWIVGACLLITLSVVVTLLTGAVIGRGERIAAERESEDARREAVRRAIQQERDAEAG